MLLTESRWQPPIRTTLSDPTMGCVSTKAEREAARFSTSSANRFQVMNVDDAGRRLCPGQLEVGDSDLILYQRGKSPVRWPLRSLRRYGFDAELFSFECGRRCPTGPGIYAFHCQRAEVLFNTVQARVAARHEEHELAGVLAGNNHISGRSNNLRMHRPRSLPASSSPATTGLLPSSSANNGLLVGMDRDEMMMETEEGSYLEPIRLQQPTNQAAAWSPHSRPLSSASLISSSSSPLSPSMVGGGNNNLYANNDVLMASVAVGDAHLDEQVLPPPSAYANLHHESMGAVGKDMDDLSADDTDSQQHLYINVGPDALEVKSRSSDGHISLVKQVNYVLLDLDKGSDSTTTASVTTTTTGPCGQLNSPEGSVASFPDSPQHRTSALLPTTIPDPVPSSSTALINAEGYATIDFDRTAALSNAAVGAPFSALAGGGVEEEGLRKTRHNSTMMMTSSSSHAARLFGLNRQTSSVSE